MSRIFLMVILFVSSFGHAAQVSNLYTVVVQQTLERGQSVNLSQAFADAAESVLIRVSGQQEALTEPMIVQARDNAPAWVAQHSVETLAQELEQDTVKQVTVTFYKESIDNFLFDHGLPVWGASRPSVLVWMIEDIDGQRKIYGSNNSSGALSDFFREASKVGVPVYAPLADKVDRANVAPSALWGFFQEDIIDASKRYDTDVVLVVRVGRYSGSYTVDSMLLYPDQSLRLQPVSGSSRSAALSQTLARLAQNLSDRYASTRAGGDPKSVQVTISGVEDYSDMSKVTSYLSSLGVVRHVQLVKVVDSNTEFNLTLDGTLGKLQNTIALSNTLAVKEPTQSVSSPILEFVYNGSKAN